MTTLTRQLAVIVVAGVLLSAIPGALAVYWLVKGRILDNEAATLASETQTLARASASRLLEAEGTLRSSSGLLQAVLADPPRPEEIEAFDRKVARDADGVWRSRPAAFDGSREAGVFLPPDARPDAWVKARTIRVKRVFDVFGAALPANVRPNIWLLTHDRGEVIIDHAYPDFVFRMTARTDYTTTPWMTLGAQNANPGREVRYTPPLYDEVSKSWMVSAVLPLDIGGRWIGNLGHDIQVRRLLGAVFGANERYRDEQHFLITEEGRFVLAGAFQPRLESSPDVFRLDAAREGELADLLANDIGPQAKPLSTDLRVAGRRHVAVGMVLQPLGWRYFRLVPTDEILAPVSRLFRALVALTFLVTLLNGLLVNRALGRRVVDRMHVLTEALRGYANGYRDRRLGAFKGADEIAEAAHAFDEMATHLDAQRHADTVVRELESHAAAGLEEQALLDRACAALSALGYPIVWIARIDPSGHGVRVAQAGNALHPEAVMTQMPGHGDEQVDIRGAAAAPTPLALAIPFGQMEQGKGVVVFHSLDQKGFTADERARLQALASRLGAAVRAAHDHRWLRLQGAALSASASGTLITDRDGNIQWVNAAFTEITGYVLSEVVGTTPRILKSGRMDDQFYLALWNTLLQGQPWSGEIVNRRKDGSLYHAIQRVTPIVVAGGRIEHFVAVQEDISEIKRKEEYIRHQATHDALTGLANRVLLNECLTQAIQRAQARGGTGAVMFLDIDRFKYVNDSLGHGEGDRLLVEVAERLQSNLHGDVTLARFGGDEFVVVLPDADGEVVMQIAESLLGVFAQPFCGDFSPLAVSVSIGVALFPEHGVTPQELIRRADAAMYQAKARGRNRHQLYSERIGARIARRLDLENQLRADLRNGSGFVLHYQLQADTQTGAPVGVEALLRWRHGDEWRLPGEFIPVAEETAIIIPLGEWVLRTACAQAKAWEIRGMPLRVAVNLSARQFHDAGLASTVARCLEATRLAPGLLELELTETAAMQDAEHAVRIMAALKSLGVSIALDDFGTGYSNLSYLTQFPIDTIKADATFVRHLGEDPGRAALMRSIVAMAHGLGMRILAEGVETETQLNRLRQMGTDYFQGNWLAKPVPADELASLMQAGGAPR